MTTSDLRDFAFFVLLLKSKGPSKGFDGDYVLAALHLRKLARSISALAVTQCNRELTPREQARRDRLDEEVSRLLAPFTPEKVETHNDPRGASIRVYWRDGRYDYRDGHGTGYAVPE